MRSWFGFCPISMKIGSLKMCGGCKLVGYFGKEDQKEDWSAHKEICKTICGMMKKLGCKHICEKISGDRLVEALGRELGRPLKQEELDMCHCICWCPKCIEKGKESHEEWCHLLKTAMEDYKMEKSLGHQVQKYVPAIATKYQ